MIDHIRVSVSQNQSKLNKSKHKNKQSRKLSAIPFRPRRKTGKNPIPEWRKGSRWFGQKPQNVSERARAMTQALLRLRDWRPFWFRSSPAANSSPNNLLFPSSSSQLFTQPPTTLSLSGFARSSALSPVLKFSRRHFLFLQETLSALSDNFSRRPFFHPPFVSFFFALLSNLLP